MTTAIYVAVVIMVGLLLAMLMIVIGQRKREEDRQRFLDAYHPIKRLAEDMTLSLAELHEVEQWARNLPESPDKIDNWKAAASRGILMGRILERGSFPRGYR